MSANRERNFGRPSLENPLSSRSRHWVKVIDRETGKTILDSSSGEAIIDGESVIVKGRHETLGKKRAFSLRNVHIEGDYIRHAQDK